MYVKGMKLIFSVLNYALNKSLGIWGEAYKSNITFNSRSINLIQGINDTVIKKSFETDDLEKGINYYYLYDLDKITFKFNNSDIGRIEQLRTEGISFCLYGMKTQKEIKKSHAMFPDEMISDNIAFAKKQSR